MKAPFVRTGCLPRSSSLPADVGAAWDRVLSADRPALPEAYTDPNISLLPPHISFEQATNLSKTLIKGDPDEGGVIVESFKNLVAGIVPGHGDKA